MWQTDQYLSPLPYKDFSYAIQNQWWQSFQSDSTWTHFGSLQLQFAKLYPAKRTNYIYALGVNTEWGAHYHFASLLPVDGFDILVGPSVLADFMAREHGSNVNKPYSMDASLDFCANAAVRYSFTAPHSSYRVQYQAVISVLGLMFTPEYGQSYYEITEGIVRHNALFSSFHNRLFLRQQLSLDMQFRHSAWRIGVRHDYLHYSANNLSFSREEVSLVVGTIFNFQSSIRPFR